MPDDAALLLADMFLGSFDAKILMSARQFLDAAIKENKVVQQFDEAFLLAEDEQVFIELEAGIVCLVFLPGQEVFFLGGDRPIFQALAVVAGKNKLNGGKEPFVEFPGLIG